MLQKPPGGILSVPVQKIKISSNKTRSCLCSNALSCKTLTFTSPAGYINNYWETHTHTLKTVLPSHLSKNSYKVYKYCFLIHLVRSIFWRKRWMRSIFWRKFNFKEFFDYSCCNNFVFRRYVHNRQTNEQ